MSWARFAAVAGLLAAGLLVQLHFLRHYPQPILFGDPAGYYSVGQRFEEALGRVSRGEEPRAVFQSVRGLMYLAGVGTVFALLDALRPGDFAFFRTVMAGFNTLAMLGAFLLGRRLAGRFAGGLVALALAAVYPSFSVQAGRLYPDPLTGCLFVWAAWLYVEALVRRNPRVMAAAGAVFMTALIVRSQVFAYLTVVLALVLAGTAVRWLRAREARRLAAGLVLGCLPFLAAWAGILRSVGDRDDVVQLGNATFNAPYLFGFWQYLETDGWIGPYRFKTEPYYQALVAASRSDRELMRSRARQAVFALRYAAQRPGASALLVLDNAYRLYDRPANDYKWDYPFSYPWQVGLQRVIVVLALAGIPLLAAARPAFLGVYLVPIALAVLHGLVFSWPRYNLPAMPTLIGIAGASLVLLAGGAWRALRQSPRTLRAAGGCVALGALALLAGLGARGLAPEAARLARITGELLLLAVPFLVLRPARRWLAAAAGGALGLLVLAHAARDRRWHEVQTVLDDRTPVIEQEIELPAAAITSVRDAPEAFLVFDLRVPRGDLSGLVLEVGDRRLPGSSLKLTMPRLPESTSAGGRDWRGYPQWWALPLDGALREEAARPLLRVRLRRQGGPPLTLGGDRFRAQGRVYEGPSFGEWPHFVPLKLEYDGDYRVGVAYPLQSTATRGFVTRTGGAPVPVRAVHRIRLITLAQSAGGLRFASAPLPRAPRVALGLGAYSGDRGSAELWRDGARVVEFPLLPPGDYEVEGAGSRLCYRAEADRGGKPYGSYFLLGPPGAPGREAVFEVRFRAGMSVEPMRFVIDRRRPLTEIGALLAGCGVPAGTPLVAAAARIEDASRNNYPEDTGRWTVAAVY